MDSDEKRLKKFRQMWLSGVKTALISHEFGITERMVHTRAARVGLIRRSRRYVVASQLPVDTRINLRAMWMAEVSVLQISRSVGMCCAAVRKNAIALGLPAREREPSGQFEDISVEEIKRRAAEIRKGWTEEERQRRVVGAPRNHSLGLRCIHGGLREPVFSAGVVPSFMIASTAPS